MDTLPLDKFDANMIFLTSGERHSPTHVALDKLAVLPGFNTRVKDAEYNERVTLLADTIERHGFYEHKPLAVVMLPNDSTVYIYDGEHRYDAAKIAGLNGADFGDGLPVTFAADGATVRDLTISLVHSNSGAQLSPIEMSAVVRRLTSYGMPKEEIAGKIGKTTRHVGNLLILATATPATKRAVATGKIAAAAVVKMISEDGAKVTNEKVATHIKKAAEAGKAKATPKTMAPAGPKMATTKTTMNLPEGEDISVILKTLAAAIRASVKADGTGKLLETGKMVLTMTLIDHAHEAAKIAATRKKEVEAAEREINRKKETEARATLAKMKAAKIAADAKTRTTATATAVKSKAADDKKAADLKKASAITKSRAADAKKVAMQKAAVEMVKTPAPVKTNEAPETPNTGQQQAPVTKQPLVGESVVLPSENGLADANRGL